VNKVRTISLRHKLRYISSNNKQLGIEFPGELPLGNKFIKDYLGVTFIITTSGNSITLTSGCVVDDMNNKNLNKLIVREEKFL